jgi:hypothetical protein
MENPVKNACLNQKNVQNILETIKEYIRMDKKSLGQKSIDKCIRLIYKVMEHNIARLSREPRNHEELWKIVNYLNDLCVRTILEAIQKKYASRSQIPNDNHMPLKFMSSVGHVGHASSISSVGHGGHASSVRSVGHASSVRHVGHGGPVRSVRHVGHAESVGCIEHTMISNPEGREQPIYTNRMRAHETMNQGPSNKRYVLKSVPEYKLQHARTVDPVSQNYEPYFQNDTYGTLHIEDGPPQMRPGYQSNKEINSKLQEEYERKLAERRQIDIETGQPNVGN